MFEENAQSYRVKDKEIYRVKLACQNTKVYRVNTQLTKGTITLLYFFCFFFAYAHAKRVRQVPCECVRTVPCACDHLIHCFPVEGHIFPNKRGSKCLPLCWLLYMGNHALFFCKQLTLLQRSNKTNFIITTTVINS